MRLPSPRLRLLTAAAVSVTMVVGGLTSMASGSVGPSTGPPPARLSSDTSPAAINSTYGSGKFGTWTVDRFGLPAYRYTLDEERAPEGRQTELDGSTDAWHQLGNDHVVANAFNHGYVQLWSQDRLYQWLNLNEPATGHFTGGYGYLNVGGRVLSTLYDDRPVGAATVREFGAGYAHRRVAAAGLEVDDAVYAPFGDDPVLLHDVTVRNTSATSVAGSWFEYWDVNPVNESMLGPRHRGLLTPAYDPATQTLAVDQLPQDTDADPLTIFATALRGPVTAVQTDGRAFFGAGGRARPAEVVANRLGGGLAPPSTGAQAGSTMFAFQTPLALAPGRSVTLRYAYGAAHRRAIGPATARYRGGDPLTTSERAWAAWLPRASFDVEEGSWVARELAWDAYLLRSGTTYEESCGGHIISQGGYYQYAMGLQGAFRDPPALMLPMIQTDPALAREVLRYSAREQQAGTGALPYTMAENCTRVELPSADLDFWLLLAASEYVLGSRDTHVLDESVPFADAGAATLWDHLKLAYRHQETVIGHGPHGGYLTAATTGDWSDFGPQFMQLTESTLMVAQLAYTYPRLALVADARGDRAFAASLRATTATLRATLDREWTGKGWYSRGYSGNRQLGAGVLYAEPQAWGLLAGTSPARAATLVANVRRYLTGVGAPKVVGGPSRIGSAQVPAATDPDVTERPLPLLADSGALGSYGGGNANYFGGVWFALNGPLVWALGRLDATLPDARRLAWDEFLRNTLANHATVYPRHWDGVLSVDDACSAWYAHDPSRCGDESLTGAQHFAGQVMNQPAWALTALLALAGVEPTGPGYRIAPHLPFPRFSLRLAGIGLAADTGVLRGYVRPEQGGAVSLEVVLPREAAGRPTTVWVDGARVRATTGAGTVSFTVPTRASQTTDWAVTWTVKAAHSVRRQSTETLAATGGLPLAPLAAVLLLCCAYWARRRRLTA